MVLLRKTLYILLALLVVLPLHAKKVQPKEVATLSVEQEQQFTYYWYAAKQAIEQERYPEALVMLEFCNMIKPNDGQTLTFLAIMYDGLGQKERALKTFKQAFEADPHDQWNRYCSVLMDMQTKAAAQEALAVLEKAYSVQKPHVEEDLLEQLRRGYMVFGEWAKAIAIQDELDKLTGYDAYSALNRYRTYAAWGKNKKAVEAIDKYLETDPTNVQFLLFRLELMEHMGVKQAELYAMYDRILALDPYNLGVLNNYAYHLATHKGDLQRAERMSAITIKEQPTNPVYLDTYGWILYMQGQKELALFYLQRALSNSENESVKAEIENHIKEVKK
jgi:tetratricopeptide (TPR) repeat protein